MFAFLPSPIKGLFTSVLFVLNTITWVIPIYLFLIPKILIPHRGFQKACTKLMICFGRGWLAGNNLTIGLFQPIKWNVSGGENLRMDRSYFVTSNHQSWVDIVILQHVLNRRIPFLRFFLKHELIYVPLLGGAWWALDFPFMKRYSKEYLKRHPEKRGLDLATTRKACEKYRGSPVSVLNFLEGTRFTKEKHQEQGAAFKYLLAPKSGGIAYAFEAMGDQFTSIVDVTIVYPEEPVSFWGLLSGKLKEITVSIREIEPPTELLDGSYAESSESREIIQTWIRQVWTEKDQFIGQFKRGH